MPPEFGYERDPSRNQNMDLDRCPSCGGAFLQDREKLEEAGSGIWFQYLECASCGHGETRPLTEAQLHDLNGVLDDRAHEVKAAAEEIERSTPEQVLGAFARLT